MDMREGTSSPTLSTTSNEDLSDMVVNDEVLDRDAGEQVSETVIINAVQQNIYTTSTQTISFNIDAGITGQLINIRISHINNLLNFITTRTDADEELIQNITDGINSIRFECIDDDVLNYINYVWQGTCDFLVSYAQDNDLMGLAIRVSSNYSYLGENGLNVADAIRRVLINERLFVLRRTIAEYNNEYDELSGHGRQMRELSHFNTFFYESFNADGTTRTNMMESVSHRFNSGPSEDDLLLQKLNKPDSRSKLFAPIGFEYTFHPRFKKETYHIEVNGRPIFINRGSRLERSVAKNLEQRFPGEKHGFNVYMDGPVLEIATPFHKSMKNLLTWYDEIEAMRRSRKLKTFSRTKGGGGLHVNMSFRKDVEWWVLGYKNFFTFIANNPEINWMFNEPSDNRTANCLWGSGGFKEFHKDDDAEITSCIGGKFVAINVKDENHFELRVFEMVRNKRDLLDIIKFVEAAVKRSFKAASYGIKYPMDKKLMNELEKRPKKRMKNARRRLKMIIEELELDFNDYKRFIDRNLEKRRKIYGPEYFK